MTKKDKETGDVTETLEDRVTRLEQQVGFVTRKLSEYRDNWKRFFSKHVSSAGDGTAAFSRPALVGAIALVLIAGLAFGVTTTWTPFNADVYGTATMTGDDSTKATTLTIGTLTVTNMTVTDLTATGTVQGEQLTSTDDASIAANLYVGTQLDLGHATDTSITRASAGDIDIEGNQVYRVGGQDVAVADGGTGLGSGTSGGVLAFTAAGTLASSAALAQYAPVIGGGAGAAPATITAGTDNQVLRGATGAACAFGSLVDGDLPATITKIIDGGEIVVAATKDLTIITDTGGATNVFVSNGAADAQYLTGNASGLNTVTASGDINANGNIVGDGSTVLTNAVIHGCTIGATEPSSGAFTTLSASGLLTASSAFTMTAGPLTLPVATKAANYTNSVTDFHVAYTPGAAFVTNTLPELSTVLGHVIIVTLINDGSGDLRVQCAAGDSFGNGACTSILLEADGDGVILHAATTALWAIVSNTGGTLE